MVHPHLFKTAIATAVPGLSLRPLTPHDFTAIDAITQEPSVAEWWRDELEAAGSFEDYLDDPGLSPFAVLWQNAIAGYAQIYHANTYPFWQCFGVPRETYGLDMFLGMAAQGRGFGLAVTNALVQAMLTVPGVARVQIDPDPRNERAIATYAKAGFAGSTIHPGYDPGTQMVYMVIPGLETGEPQS